MLRYLRFRWWRLRTWARLTFSPALRAHWRGVFEREPCLFNARHHGDYATMAGFYNDTTPGGFMQPHEAKSIYRGAR